MRNTKTYSPSLFLTDYASYNQGTQFEFGHWVDLDEFDNHYEFLDYIKRHFEKCDEESPLACGAKREEAMFADYENFPSELYSESCSISDLEAIFNWIELSEDEKISVAFILDQTGNFDYAIDNHEKIYLREFDFSFGRKYELFEEYYPEAEKIENSNPYVNIDYNSFIDDYFIRFSYDGIVYLVDTNWDR